MACKEGPLCRFADADAPQTNLFVTVHIKSTLNTMLRHLIFLPGRSSSAGRSTRRAEIYFRWQDFYVKPSVKNCVLPNLET